MSSRRVVGSLLCLASLVLASCGGSGFQYVKNDEEQLFVKVPDEWTVFDDDDYSAVILAGEDQSTLEKQREIDRTWFHGFSLGNGDFAATAEPSGTAPAGSIRVRDLNADERGVISLAVLRTYGWPVLDDQPIDPLELSQEPGGPVVLLSYEELVIEGRAHGVHARAAIDGLADETVIRDVIALVDDASTQLYVMVVGCDVACFETHLDDIDSIVESFTLEEEKT